MPAATAPGALSASDGLFFDPVAQHLVIETEVAGVPTISPKAQRLPQCRRYKYFASAHKRSAMTASGVLPADLPLWTHVSLGSNCIFSLATRQYVAPKRIRDAPFRHRKSRLGASLEVGGHKLWPKTD